MWEEIDMACSDLQKPIAKHQMVFLSEQNKL